MVTLVVKNITETCSDNYAGLSIYDLIKDYFKKGQTVTVSFDGIPYVSTSFVNSAFINLLQDYSFEQIRKDLKFSDSNVQINSLIKERFAFETTKTSALVS